MPPRSFQSVCVLVDWQSQLLATPSELENSPGERSGIALRYVGKQVVKHLCALDTTSLFRVRLRLYHGWTTGTSQTINRRAVSALPEMLAPDDIFPSSRILSMSDIEFGDRLIDALPERENKGMRIHLPNTCRKRRGEQRYEEKMVDTALAVDLLSWARTEPDSLAFVFSADDDMVPPIFIAEAWMKPFGGVVKLVRPPTRGEGRYLALEGLECR